jgi:hypothetical protein
MLRTVATVVATATVDTVAPVISQVAAVTGIGNAVVSLEDLQAGGFAGAIR